MQCRSVVDDQTRRGYVSGRVGRSELQAILKLVDDQ
jgi:hypothetical protein